jgi:hypothetical protein
VGECGSILAKMQAQRRFPPFTRRRRVAISALCGMTRRAELGRSTPHARIIEFTTVFMFLFPLTIFAALGSLTGVRRQRSFAVMSVVLGLIVTAGLLAGLVEGRAVLALLIITVGVGGSALVGLLLGGAAAWLVRRAEPPIFRRNGSDGRTGGEAR